MTTHIIRGGLSYNMELRWDGVRLGVLNGASGQATLNSPAKY
jgi:hypothetical protein